MNNSAKIAAYTIRDQMRHKSLYVLLAAALLFIFMVRGCYRGQFEINGRMMERAALVGFVSKAVFQLTAAGMFLVAALLAMRIFSRDHADGSMTLFLSRPVLRRQYLLGRIAGTWLLCSLFMFVLHLALSLTVWAETGQILTGYLTASLISSVNLLFIIVCVCLLSLYVPDFLSVVFTVLMLTIGFISDGGYQLMSSRLAQAMIPPGAHAGPALWRVLYPKIFIVQSYAGSRIGAEGFHNMGPLNPVLNVFFYVLLLTALILIGFNRKEI